MADIADPIGTIVPIRSSIEQEFQLIREAIAMVAGGKSPRVVLGGVRYTEVLLDSAERLALRAGVTVKPLLRADSAGTDLSVERSAQ